MTLTDWLMGRKPQPVSDREWLRRAAADEPVSDKEFREAYEYFERHPGTDEAPCSDPKPHGDHLWRHVFVPGGPTVDESMKRCPGRAWQRPTGPDERMSP